MRIASLHGRAHLVLADGFLDIAEASEGRFSSSTRDLCAVLPALREWAATLPVALANETDLAVLESDERLAAVIAEPRQVIAVGLNYREHAHEMGLANPTTPMIFTKFASTIAGQHATIPVVSEKTDWEAELVVVIGTGGRNIAEADALHAVAGYCVGQDISDRELQMSGSPAQFSLGKSWRNFGPIGPWLTTLDEVSNPLDLAIRCSVNGETMQDSRTSDMVFNIAEVVSYVSRVLELFPGDIIFTGSPHGVGQGQVPPRFLAPGDVLETTIEGLGTLHNVMVAH